jgi:myo-inositol 2-dehydrogenase / D-chiro-inositol 1-dehydrogenase
MGSGHARYITEHVSDAEVIALSDIDLNRANQLATQIKTPQLVTGNVNEIFTSELVDAVIIASPDNLHVEHLRLAIAAGKPTLCEKPIATTIEEARSIAKEISDFQTKAGKQLIHFGFMRRFDPQYRKVRELINSGKFGAPLFIRVVTRNVASTGATDNGLYTNIAIHDFDIFRWMFNSDFVQVESHYPKRNSLSQSGLSDPLIITAKLANGIMMIADIVAFNNYGYDARFEILCEKGSIEVGIFGDVVTRLNFEATPILGGHLADNWMARFERSYIEEVNAWVNSINSGVVNKDLATVDDALAANEACQLGVNSIQAALR